MTERNTQTVDTIQHAEPHGRNFLWQEKTSVAVLAVIGIVAALCLTGVMLLSFSQNATNLEIARQASKSGEERAALALEIARQASKSSDDRAALAEALGYAKAKAESASALAQEAKMESRVSQSKIEDLRRENAELRGRAEVPKR